MTYRLSLLSSVALTALGTTLAHAQQLPSVQPTELPPINVTTPKPKAATLERTPVQADVKPAVPAPSAAPAAKAKAATTQAAAPAAPAPSVAPTGDAGSAASVGGVATSDSGTSASVITARDIEGQQIRTAVDALRALPGVSVNRSGNSGGLTQVRLRGAEANHTLVIIDGIQANTTADGEFDFSNLSADDIERIEVVRGPMSGLYGTGAIGGVVAITTKRGRGPAQLTVRSEAGSFGSRDVALRASGGNEQAHLSVSGQFRKTDGFNITLPGVATTDERDGTRIGSFALNGGIKLAPNASLDVTVRKTDKFAERDGFEFFGRGVAIDDPSTLKSAMLMAGAALKVDALDGKLTHELRLDHSSTRNTDFDRGPFGDYTTKNTSERLTAGYAATYRLDMPAIAAKHAITGLVQTETERFTPQSDFEDGIERKRQRVSVAGEVRSTFAKQIDTAIGARHDNNDVFNDFTTWRASAAWRVPNTGLRPHASVGTAVKLPSMFEQFGRFPTFFVPNPNLKPERSTGFDAGVELSFAGGKAVIDVTYFRSILEDKIATRGFPEEPFNTVGKSRREGVEVAGRFAVMPGVSLGMAYTYTDARDVNGDREIRRPPHSARLDLASTFAGGNGSVNLAAVYNGGTIDRTFCLGLTCPPARVELESAWVVSLAASYKLSKEVELFGRVENALDAKYQEIYGYNTPGIAAFAGVKLTFGGP